MINELSLKNISKKFKDFNVLENISITFSGGKIYGLVGPNGSGKSVLLKIMSGLMTQTEGSIYYNNVALDKTNFEMINIGASIEKPSFIDDLSGLENLMYLAKFKKLIDKDTILYWMKKFDLYDVRNKRVSAYSLGMRQKLAIIQSVMEDQEIILLDEVSNSLDQKSKLILREMLSDLKSKEHIIIYVNHNINEVKEYCDEIYMIENKRLVLC